MHPNSHPSPAVEGDAPRRGAATKVVSRLQELGVSGEVRELPEPAPTAAAAAAQLGCEVGAIANSLIFAVGGDNSGDARPLLILTSGAHRVDTAKVAALLGETAGETPTVRRASPEFVRQHTGQPIGGVAPVGHPAAIPTLVDVWLGEHEVVWAAGGHPNTVFPTSFSELVQITSGTVADVGAERPAARTSGSGRSEGPAGGSGVVERDRDQDR